MAKTEESDKWVTAGASHTVFLCLCQTADVLYVAIISVKSQNNKSNTFKQMQNLRLLVQKY